MPKGDKNQNGKKNTETKITRKKAIKLSKKREKIEKLQKVPEGTSQKVQEGTSEGRSPEFELCRSIRIAQHGTWPWRSDIVIESIITVSLMT
jgi:hypothetical protein